MKKVIWSIVLSWVCLAFAAAGIGTRDAVSACDGKVYKKGDKIWNIFAPFYTTATITMQPIRRFVRRSVPVRYMSRKRGFHFPRFANGAAHILN